MPYWCGACKKYFNIRTNTLMEYSRLPLRKWIIAMYLFQTKSKGISFTHSDAKRFRHHSKTRMIFIATIASDF
ncbi:MAG: hypothetical protein OXC67_03420 [Flavobacteriaceae bacterium]|nr:hypothetical protein [Flavobacteriaceae bacterium]